MLVLSRKLGEKLVITVPGCPKPIVVVCGGWDKVKVRIGVDAPPDVIIDREEVWERKQARAKEAPVGN